MFHMLRSSKEVEGYHKVAKEQWRGLNVEGWGMYVLKEN